MLLALAPCQQLEMPGSTLTQAGQQQICQWPQSAGNAWFHLLCSISKQAVLLQGPAAYSGTCPVPCPCSSNPFFDVRLCHTHLCVLWQSSHALPNTINLHHLLQP